MNYETLILNILGSKDINLIRLINSGEVTTPALKGRLGILYSVLLVSGILVTSLFGWLNWRVISGISAVAPLIFFIAMFFVPESPYHLFKSGKKNSVKYLQTKEFYENYLFTRT